MFSTSSSWATLRIYICRWVPGHSEQVWVQESVFQAILTLDGLRHFTFHNTTNSRLHLPLSSLPPLHSLSLTGAYDELPAIEFFNDVAELVSKSPTLSYLKIFGGLCRGKPMMAAQSVSYLLSRSTDPQSVLSLRSLHISDILFRLDHLTLPHLRNLRSFTLEYSGHPFSTNTSSFSSTESLPRLQEIQNTHPELLKWGSTRTEIWEAFKREGIWLSEIKTNHVCLAFLVYLESYGTLEKLELCASNFQEEESSNIAGSRFFNRSIMGHTKSLRHLSVRAPYEGRWSYEPLSSAERIVHFKNLECLEVGVNPGELRPSAKSDEPRYASNKGDTKDDILVCASPLFFFVQLIKFAAEEPVGLRDTSPPVSGDCPNL